MTISTHPADLSKIANIVSRVATSNTNLPLSRTLLEARDGQLVVTATDGDVTVRATCVCGPGELRALVDAREIAARVKHLPHVADVEVSVVGGALRLAEGRAATHLETIDPDLYPDTTPGEAHGHELPRTALVHVLRGVEHAMGHEITPIERCGVLLEVGPHHLRAVATDGHRLAVRGAEDVQPQPGADTTLLVPALVVRELLHATGDVVEIGENSAKFSVGAGVLLRRHLTVEMCWRARYAGAFPPWRKILPYPTDARARFARSLLLQTLKTFRSSKRDVVTLDVAHNTCRISCSGTQVEIPCEGKKFTVALNARYLLDAAALCADEDIALEQKKRNGPVVIRDSFGTHLIAPVRQ